MTMTNAEWCIKNGIPFRKVGRRPCSDPDFESIGYYTTYGNFNECYKGKCLGYLVSESILTWLDMEHKEPILDEAERRYLSAVIRPFRDKVISVAKFLDTANGEEYIVIDTGEETGMFFPDFEANTMYKGMVLRKDYTPEELGI